MNIYYYRELDEKWANASIYASNKEQFSNGCCTHLQTLKDETTLYICFDERSVPSYLHIINPDDLSIVYTMWNPDLKNRVIQTESIFNFRDFGGYPCKNGKKVKRNVFFRSGKLHSIDKEGIKKLHELDIRTIIDLRSSLEVNAMPTPPIDDIYNTNIQIGADMDGKSSFFLNDKFILNDPESYAQFKDDSLGESYRIFANSTDSYRKIFNFLLDGNAPVLLHCTAGKDRTGVTCALILLALGVEPDLVFMDYLLTNNFKHDIARDITAVANLDAFGEELDKDQFANMLTTFIHAKPSYLEKALDEMKKEYGSVSSFIKDGIGLTSDEISALQDMYLE